MSNDSQPVSGNTERGRPEQRRNGFFNRFWRRIRGPLARSALLKALLIRLISGYLKLVYLTNRQLEGSADPQQIKRDYAPFIVTFWHGQHLMGPFVRPEGVECVAMFSRSNDAELNAGVAERLGLQTVRGSGGRTNSDNSGKGGARALLVLKKALDKGKSAAIIADVAHSKTREAGQGIILLAKLSGRPIIPTAYAFSRNKVLTKSWDKTTIPLPFGRSVVITGEPVYVAGDADDMMLETKRAELTARLNHATAEAYARLGKVDGTERNS